MAPYELIIIDDGSIDKSSKICDQFASTRPYVKVIHQNNQGQGAARNRALNLVTGDYVLFLDGDDLFEPDFFSLMVSNAEEENSDIVCCRSDEYDHNTKQYKKNDGAIKSAFLPDSRSFHPESLKGTTFLTFIGWAWDKIFKVSLIKKYNLYFPNLHNSEDLVFVFQALAFSQKITIEYKTLVHHRVNRSSSVSNRRTENIFAYYAAYRLLKKQIIDKDSNIWRREEWGAINWLTSYTYWALNSINTKSLRDECLLKIQRGFCPEYEFDKHPREYYGLSLEGYDFIHNKIYKTKQIMKNHTINNTLKFSIIIPAYNSEKYIKKCLQSLQEQLYDNFEAICINDGSTDDTLAVMSEIALKDNRFKIINKPNTGYGDSINIGLSLAHGDYIGILESDDYADSSMLADYAEKIFQHGQPDFVKSNFMLYWETPKKQIKKLNIFKKEMYDRPFNPLEDYPESFFSQPAIWSSFYRKDFLTTHNINCLSTPGASFQDTSFNFKCWYFAKKVVLIEKPYIFYRQDNENSSINNKGKIYAICKEFEAIKELIRNTNHSNSTIDAIYSRMLFDAYIWNYKRIATKYKTDFAKIIQQEICSAKFDKNTFFSSSEKIIISSIIYNREIFNKIINKIQLTTEERKSLIKTVIDTYGLSSLLLLLRKRVRKILF